ncbi:MAG: radical SAM protein [Candidatus Omnitrophica bacterium]|nr:radical SAM protein [Candidatus Omnitrophota bacterium]
MSFCDRSQRSENRTGDFPLGTLYVNPTRYCNLRCRHCWIAPPVREELVPGTEEMSMDEITAIAEAAKEAGLGSIKLTGGEPLLRKDIGELLSYCVSSDISVFMETNGTLVSRDVARMLADNNVSQVSVSLDSMFPEVHDRLRGKKGAFERSVSGIKNLIASGIRPQVILSLYRENLRGFERFLDFMEDLGVNDVKVNIITPMGRGHDLQEKGMAPVLEEVLEFYRRTEKMRNNFRGNCGVDVPPAFQKVEDIKKRGCRVCGIKSILGILPNGDVSICGVGFMERDMIMGNVRKAPGKIKDIWKNDPIVRFIREKLPEELEGVCGICVFRKVCLGGCRAEVWYNNHDLKSPFWFCQKAYDKGLFPSTRLMPEELRVR